MQLIVDELGSVLFQQLTPPKNRIITAIRPHLYVQGTPTGTITMQVRDANGNVMFTGDTVNMNVFPGPYWHGYQRFYINAAVQMNVPFQVALVTGGGYAFSPTSFVGWCSGFDLGKYAATYSTPTGTRAPRDVEVWGYEEQKRGFA